MRQLASLSLALLAAFCAPHCQEALEIPELLLVPPASTRPAIVASYPSPLQTSVSKNDNVFVEFDREMDQEATALAFSVGGATPPSGDVHWAGRRILFSPDPEFVPGTDYVLRVGATAESKDGVALGVEYLVHFLVGTRSDGPAVVAVDPSPNAQGVATTAPVSLYLSRPMDRASVEAAFFLSPSVAGAFQWSVASDSFVFQPFSALVDGTTYAINLGTGARDSEGIALGDVFSSSFRVGSDFVLPVVLGVREFGSPLDLISPAAGVSKDSQLEMRFSEAMDFAQTQNAFQLLRRDNNTIVSGHFEWNAAFDTVRFVPDEALEPEHEYRLLLSTGAADLAGNALALNFVLDFRTDASAGALNSDYLDLLSLDKTQPLPAETLFLDPVNLSVISVAGSNGPTGGPARLELTFSRSLDPATVAENFSVSRVIGLDPPLNPVVSGVQLQPAGALPNARLIILLDSLGQNEYHLTLFGGRNGIRSAPIGAETGTWLETDPEFFFRVTP
ncbi:MAG: Ig-like domain-containing protein [Spirochaetales bacterium]|nr:Ig-like domain-containing protein [Leptospiraceae bacterium]MCP5479909.1 Ig-like domain-containing protein [Spirochaetales bacterium]MCP5486656.1 Ig-like domain-containing protein [Spirochaetales bacterium]